MWTNYYSYYAYCCVTIIIFLNLETYFKTPGSSVKKISVIISLLVNFVLPNIICSILLVFKMLFYVFMIILLYYKKRY